MLGVTVGNYAVRAQIGLGGMGAVYLAEHATLGRRAAVKVLLPELSHDRDIVTRFFNEARAATAIRHPGIVEVYDFGYLHDGQAYIVMELLEGETLGSRRNRLGTIEPARAVALARQIAGALDAAHERGIVHRDLKPDNVFLVADPEVPSGERIKILDFGIAKLTSAPGDTSRTQTGSVLGTPTYMAPEQCRGAGDVDARADLYALGCLLYELVCGRPPFVAEGAGELIAHHLYFEPAPPRTLDPSIPEAVEGLIAWLLQKDPAMRPQRARDFVDAVDRLSGATERSMPRQSQVMPIVTPPTPTTLSGAAGATTPAPMPPPTGGSRWWVIPSVALVTITAGLASWAVIARDAGGKHATQVASEPPAPPAAIVSSTPSPSAATPDPIARDTAATAKTATPAATTDPIRLSITTDPPGATVFVESKPIGTTPFEETVPRGTGARRYKLQMSGYDTVRTSLRLDRDAAKVLTLHKKDQQTPSSFGDRGVNPFE